MNLLLWIFVGWAVGWLTGRSLEGKGYGPSMDVLMGICGAVVGGLAMRELGVSGYGETALTTLAAVCCGGLFTTVTGVLNGRSVYSRQLGKAYSREGSALKSA